MIGMTCIIYMNIPSITAKQQLQTREMQGIPFPEYYPDGHMWPYMCGVKSSRRADEYDIVAVPNTTVILTLQ